MPETTEKVTIRFNDGPWRNVGELQEHAQRAGSHFFDPDTMRFFRSKVAPDLYAGRIFITSEKHESNYPEPIEPRMYTVRIAVPQKGHGIALNDIGGFQAFETLARARTFARDVSKARAFVLQPEPGRYELAFDLPSDNTGERPAPCTCRYWELKRLEKLARRLNRERKIKN